MKETDLYGPIKEDLRQLRGAIVMKHADRFTRDIPDFQVCMLGVSAWAEIKLRRPGESMKKVVDRSSQILMASLLSTACDGRSWVIVYEQRPKRVVVWQPRTLFGHLWPNVAGPLVNELGVVTAEPDPESPSTWLPVLHSYGVIAVPWSYGVFRTLITESFHQ